MAFELKKCSEVKKGIRRSHFALKLKRKQKITPHSLCYEILSLHPLHQAVISARQGENGQKKVHKTFQRLQSSPCSCPSHLLGAAHVPFSQGQSWGYLQPPPPTCSFSGTKILQLRVDLLTARGQRLAKVLHSNHKEFQATFKQQRVSQVLSHTRKQFSGSELYLLLSSPPQGYFFFLIH